MQTANISTLQLKRAEITTFTLVLSNTVATCGNRPRGARSPNLRTNQTNQHPLIDKINRWSKPQDRKKKEIGNWNCYPEIPRSTLIPDRVYFGGSMVRKRPCLPRARVLDHLVHPEPWEIPRYYGVVCSKISKKEKGISQT